MWAVYLMLFGGLALFVYVDIKASAMWEYFSTRAYSMAVQAGGKQSLYGMDESTFVTHDGPQRRKNRIMRND